MKKNAVAAKKSQATTTYTKPADYHPGETSGRLKVVVTVAESAGGFEAHVEALDRVGEGAHRDEVDACLSVCA